MVDQELFDQCKRNNAKAQRALYDAYKSKLMGLCRRYARTREDAKDMLQETFIKVFSKISQVENLTTLEAWMKSIAVHTSIDHYHKQKKNELIHYYTEEDHEVQGDDEKTVIQNMSDEFLITLINELPEGCRMVLNLFEVEGYTHAEIATMMSITEGTSRSQLYHAKYLLRKRLSAYGMKRYEKFA